MFQKLNDTKFVLLEEQETKIRLSLGWELVFFGGFGGICLAFPIWSNSSGS